MSLRLPNTPTLRQAIRGALLELTYTKNWEAEEGSISPEDISQVMRDAYGTLSQGCSLKPGDIVLSAAGETPENRLDCDGAEYLADDYPLLFAAIGYSFGGTGAIFKVPDFRNRSPVGQGDVPGWPARDVGDTGGANEATLTDAELPTHYHGSHAHTTTLLNGGLEAPVIVLVEAPGNTGNAGSGQPFDLHTPFAVVRFTIVYQ